MSTALVTGGAGGIGEAIASALAGSGSEVAVADIDEVAARKVARRIGGFAVPVDVTDQHQVEAAVEQVAGTLGPIDVLVNSAGVVGGAGPLATLPPEALTTVLDVNVVGTFLMMRAVSAAMMDNETGGAIVNISSAGAFQPTAGLGHYEASKAAVNALTRSAALELAPYGIRVNAIAPGPVETPMTGAALADPEARGRWLARIPLGRIAVPEDLVPLVVLLASAGAGHITGTVIPVDGGQLLAG